MGEAPEAIVLVESPEDVARLEVADETKLAYLTQTTLSVDDANRIIVELKERFPQIDCAAEGRHLLRDAESPGSGARSWRPRRTWCWCWAARTVRTASGWRNSPRERGVPAYLIDGAAGH